MTRPPTESNASRTKSSKRSTVAARRKVRSDNTSSGRSTLTDLTRPVARDRRLLQSRFSRWMVPIGTIGIVVAFAFVLFVRPVQTYFEQERLMDERTAQHEQILTVNGQLRAEVERLKTPDGIKEAAREQVGYINEGEQRLTVNTPEVVPTDLPAGWPYDIATEILATRSRPPDPIDDTSATDDAATDRVPTPASPASPSSGSSTTATSGTTPSTTAP